MVDGIVEITRKPLFFLIRQARFDFDFYEYRWRDYRTWAGFNDANVAGCKGRGFIDDITDGVGKYIDTFNQQHIVDTALEQHSRSRATATAWFGSDLNDVLVSPADQRPALPL